MLSQQYSLQEKSIGGYVIGIFFIITSPLYFVTLFITVVDIILGIAFIVKQRNHNRRVPENNILVKYIQYIEQIHSEIPENYHEAILFNLRSLHYSSFGGFNEDITFSTDQLDQHIDEFMKDADHNLKEYAKTKLA